MIPTSNVLSASGVLVVVQALEGQALPPLAEGESLPLKEVELHQVGHFCLSVCVFVCLSVCLLICLSVPLLIYLCHWSRAVEFVRRL